MWLSDCTEFVLSRIPAEEDRRGRVWGDLRGPGPANAGERGAEGGVGPAAQTGAEDGGGGAEEAAGWDAFMFTVYVQGLTLLCVFLSELAVCSSSQPAKIKANVLTASSVHQDKSS